MELLQSQFKDQERQIVSNLDKHISRKAQFLARSARVSKDYLEPLFVIGVLGMRLQPQGYLNAPLWLASGGADLSFDLFLKRPSDIVIKDAEDVLAHADTTPHQAQEYFQTYSRRGKIQQKSETLGDRLLPLDEQLRGMVQFRSEHFDTVEPEPGWKLRVVTIKAAR